MEPLTGTVAELWRWPVLGMAPERLRAARLGRRGMAGDGVHLVMAGEELLEAGALAGWSAEYPFNVDSAIDPEHPPQALVIPPDRARRWRWGDPRLIRALTATAGRPVELRREPARTSPIIDQRPARRAGARAARVRDAAGAPRGPRDRVRQRHSPRGHGPGRGGGGIEARVVTGGRVQVGWSFTLV